MPEGDTIHSAARRVGAALVGHEIMEIETPQRRHALDRWPERLAGREVRTVRGPGLTDESFLKD
jgi:endonuclease VIII